MHSCHFRKIRTVSHLRLVSLMEPSLSNQPRDRAEYRDATASIILYIQSVNLSIECHEGIYWYVKTNALFSLSLFYFLARSPKRIYMTWNNSIFLVLYLAQAQSLIFSTNICPRICELATSQLIPCQIFHFKKKIT